MLVYIYPGKSLKKWALHFPLDNKANFPIGEKTLKNGHKVIDQRNCKWTNKKGKNALLFANTESSKLSWYHLFVQRKFLLMESK